MRKLKIAILTLEFPPRIMGGAGVIITRIAEEVARRGYEIHVLTLGAENGYRFGTEREIGVHRLPAGPFPRWSVLAYWMSLPYWFGQASRKVGGFDLVHSSGIADLTLRRPHGSCPRIVTVYHLASSVVWVLKPSLWQRVSRPGEETGLGPVWEETCIRRADWLTTISRATHSDILSRFRFPPERIRIIPVGAELDGYVFSAREISNLRSDLGVGDASMILFVGRLEARKGVEDLLQAFSGLEVDRDAVLVLAGSGETGTYRRLAERLGILDRVRMVGFVRPFSEELKKLYSASDLVAIPSAYEGLGLVALEARAAGKFIVAYRVGGLPEAVTEEAGYLVPPRDWRAFSQAMGKALRTTHTGIPKPRSWNDVGEDYRRFYEDAASDAGNGISQPRPTRDD